MNPGRTIGICRGQPGDFADRWAEVLSRRGIGVCWLDLLGPDPLRQVAGCDGVMWHWYHYPHEIRLAALPILRTLEEPLQLPVFPDLATCWHYDDKIAQAYLLEALGIPHPPTWIFWRKAEALAWCRDEASYPLVAKLAGGAGSQHVQLLRDAASACTYVRACFSGAGILSRPPLPANPMARWWRLAKNLLKRIRPAAEYVFQARYPAWPHSLFWMPQKNYALFQEFLPGNDFDTRVTVIGNRAFAYRRFNRPNDFRASGSGKFDVDPAAIDRRCLATAFASARKLGSQSMAFDLLFRGAEPESVVAEISYAYVDWMVEQCPGHWDAELNWHEGRMWPEEAHVEDFLARVESRRNAVPTFQG